MYLIIKLVTWKILKFTKFWEVLGFKIQESLKSLFTLDSVHGGPLVCAWSPRACVYVQECLRTQDSLQYICTAMGIFGPP